MYGVLAGLGTCPVWVCSAVLLPQPDLLNESTRTTEADGIACGILGRLRKRVAGWFGSELVQCGDVVACPFCPLVISAGLAWWSSKRTLACQLKMGPESSLKVS